MPAVAFVTDAPRHIFLEASKFCSRIQLAKTGKFKDPRYGSFAITTAMFDKWTANFAALSSPAAGRRGAPLDFDHNPEKRGDTEAAGWIVSMDRMGKDGKTPTPSELWGDVEWTDVGLAAVKEGRYAYISPSYAENYVDEEGKQHGTHMVGAALTNRPFLRMATISLSASPFATEDAPEPPDSPSHMPELTKEFLTSLGLSDEKAVTVLAATDPAAACKVALAEVATTEPVPEPPKEEAKYDGKTLTELAKESGMVIMSGADVAKLAADAAKGAAAADTLHTKTFSDEWATAVDKGKVLPAAKSTFVLAYDADPAATIKQLHDLPEGTIPTALRGAGVNDGEAANTPTALSATTKADLALADASGDRIEKPDNEREKMAVRLDALLAEGKSDDEAFAIVESEFAGAVA